MKEPFNLTMDQIKTLNRWTLFNVYFRARDRQGRLIFQSKPARVLSHKEVIFEHYRKLGVAERHLPGLWQEYQAKVKRQELAQKNAQNNKQAR